MNTTVMAVLIHLQMLNVWQRKKKNTETIGKGGTDLKYTEQKT